MNELIAKNFHGHEVHTFMWNDRLCWIANEVVSILDYADASTTIGMCIASEGFSEGKEYDTLTGDTLRRFKKFANSQTNFELVRANVNRLIIFYEAGLYGFVQHTEKPIGVEFRTWLRRDVLPEIRATGAYVADKSRSKKVPSLDDAATKEKLAEAKLNNSRARLSSVWLKLAEYVPEPEYKQVCAHYASGVLAGHDVLPLPDAGERLLSADDIGKIFGISANKIGRLSNQHNMKVAEFGKWKHDKSRYSSKQVESFYYNHRAVDRFREILGGDAGDAN